MVGLLYATERARDGALARGFDFSLADWRDLFLAITDFGDSTKSRATHVTASYLGPVRDGERWAITWRNRRLDVIYEPHRAVVSNVVDPHAGTGVVALSPRPRAGSPAAALV